MKLLLSLLLVAMVAAGNGAPVARAYGPAWLRPRPKGRRRATPARTAGRHSKRGGRPEDPRDAETVRIYGAINAERRTARALAALTRSGPAGAQAAIAYVRSQVFLRSGGAR